jgi:60 kDa SS-A/Ro ribonucleoprotein
MRINTPLAYSPVLTHEGAPAKRIDAEKQLRRLVLASMLWEDQFYIDGQSSAQLIAECIAKVAPQTVAEIAIEARERQKLRHVPLLLVRELARRKDNPAGLVAKTLARVIQRPDELAEFLAIYWKDKKQPLAAQVKKGLAAAFQKFDAYALAKYNRDGAVKLRDVLFLSHAKAKDAVQAETFKKLTEQTLESPDTWEVALSSGDKSKSIEEKRAHWQRLLAEKKLGALALLRNLRNMQQASVPESEIRAALAEAKTDRVLPFRFVAAARYAPALEDALEGAMLRCVANAERLPGRTLLLVDVSGSMDAPISAKSDMKRMDAAAGLAVLLREIAEQVAVVTFSHQVVQVPPRRGFALRDAIVNSQPHGATYLGAAVTALAQTPRDRMIVITDEQSHDAVPAPNGNGYVINVAAHQNGVGYGQWTHIDGWSEAVIDFIRQDEPSSKE